MNHILHAESRELPKSLFDMGLPSTTDKVWLHTGVIVCSCNRQSEPRESEITLELKCSYKYGK